jgi:hypothetical protein
VRAASSSTGPRRRAVYGVPTPPVSGRENGIAARPVAFDVDALRALTDAINTPEKPLAACDYAQEEMLDALRTCPVACRVQWRL